MNERDYKLYIQSLEGRVILNNDHRKIYYLCNQEMMVKNISALLDATGNVCYLEI